MHERNFNFFVAGFASVFLLKYVVVGLNKWNEIFHPERAKVENGSGLFFK